MVARLDRVTSDRTRDEVPSINTLGHFETQPSSLLLLVEFKVAQ